MTSDGAAGQIRVRIIGEGQIEAPGGRVTSAAEVFFTMLLVLAVERGRGVKRERLIELFWASEPPLQARHNLRQLLYKATKRFGIPVQTDAGLVELPVAAVYLDIEDGVPVEEWNRMTAPGGRLSIALDLPPGAGDALQLWADRLRSRAEAVVRERLLREIGAARLASDWERVEQLSRHCLAMDPLNEEATLGLAESLALAGSKAQAVRLLSTYEEEVGGGESPVALPARVLRRRIRKTTAVGHEDLNGLLLGRDAELRTLTRRLQQAATGNATVTLIVGEPGSGKSRILTEVSNIAVLEGFQTFYLSAPLGSSELPASGLAALTSQLLEGNGSLGAAPQSLATLKSLTSAEAGSAVLSTVGSDQIASALIDLIRALCYETPVVILLDDVHRLDGLSSAHLFAAFDSLRRERLCTVLSASPTNITGALPASQTLHLGALSRDNALALATRAVEASGRSARAEILTALVDTTTKQPWDILAACDAYLAGDSPTQDNGLTTHLKRRLDALPTDDRRLFITIVLLSAHCTLATLEAITGKALVALEDQLLRLVTGGYVSLQQHGLVVVSSSWQSRLDEVASPTELVLRRQALARQFSEPPSSAGGLDTPTGHVAATLYQDAGDTRAAATQRLHIVDALIGRGLGWASAAHLGAVRPHLTESTTKRWSQQLHAAIASAIQARAAHELAQLLTLSAQPSLNWAAEDRHTFQLADIQRRIMTREANDDILTMVNSLLSEAHVADSVRHTALLLGTKAADHINDALAVLAMSEQLLSQRATSTLSETALRTVRLVALIAQRDIAQAVEEADSLADTLRASDENGRNCAAIINCRIPHVFDSNHSAVGAYIKEALEMQHLAQHTSIQRLTVLDCAATYYVDSLDFTNARHALSECVALTQLFSAVGYHFVLSEVQQRLAIAMGDHLPPIPNPLAYQSGPRRLERHQMFSLCHHAVSAARRRDRGELQWIGTELDIHWQRLRAGSPFDLVAVSMAICSSLTDDHEKAVFDLESYYANSRVARHAPTPFVQQLLDEFALPSPTTQTPHN